jgi:hypothetical protein
MVHHAVVQTTPTFIEHWNALDRPSRMRLRRLVRLGRSIDEPDLARLAASYASYQTSRPWIRYFWVWFVPGILLALSIAASVHPAFVGVTLALGAQAVLANVNLRRTARRVPGD